MGTHNFDKENVRVKLPKKISRPFFFFFFSFFHFNPWFSFYYLLSPTPEILHRVTLGNLQEP